jgi:hypothetical protein
MSHRTRISVEMAIAIAILTPVAVAQKPPAPTTPPAAPPTRSTTLPPTLGQPGQPSGDLVMFLRGRVATDDGTPIPHDVVVERVCNERIRQQVHASGKGDFSMQLGSKEDAVLDASGEQSSDYGETNRDTSMGIPRQELRNCELRASSSGFHSGSVSLISLDNFGGSVEVGTIVVQRATKIEGSTLSAIPYRAPPDARKAYEKGLEAERKGRDEEARKYFESAVQIYPKYTSGWFQLGGVLQRAKQKDAARSAFLEATKIDSKFLPPYVSLAAMAYEAENWSEVLKYSGHVVELDPSNHGDSTHYFLDMDAYNCDEAYYFNAVANYKLDRLDEAERSGLRAEHIDLLTDFPQLHLLMAEIYSRKNNNASAISELKTYLELVPRAKNAERVREQLAKLEMVSSAAPVKEKTD